VHASDVVLDALEALLQGIPGLEDHIVKDQGKLPSEIDLPWCWLNLGDEEISTQGLSGKKTRSLFINIDLLASDRYQAMQKANEIAGAIEDRVDANPTLGGIAGNTVLANVIRGRNDELNLARVRIVYNVTYWTRAGASSTPV